MNATFHIDELYDGRYVCWVSYPNQLHTNDDPVQEAIVFAHEDVRSISKVFEQIAIFCVDADVVNAEIQRHRRSA